jgi:hypothetical protein
MMFHNFLVMVQREMGFSSSRLSAKKPGEFCPQAQFFKACGGSEIKASKRFSGGVGLPKNGDGFYFVAQPKP